MKPSRHGKAFTRLELLITLVALAAVVILIVPWRSDFRARDQRIACVSNLKMIGLGFRMWSNDHRERFPWQISTNQGGTLEYADSTDVWRHFQAVSNELNIPKILPCLADISRGPAAQWNALRNTNISYFVSMDMDTFKPERIFAGDRFVSTNSKVISGLLITTNSLTLRWIKGGHHKAGNAAMLDGSVHQMSTAGLRAGFSNQTVRLIIP